MTALLYIAALVLTGSLLLGLLQLFRSRTPEDRMVAVQLMGTTGVGLLLVFGPLFGIPASVDVALVLALLAAVAVAALTRESLVDPRHD